MTKVQLKVYITKDLRDLLDEFVRGKYSSSYGGLSVEVQNALAHWISEQGLAAHTQTRINPGLPRIQEKIERLIQWLRDKGYTNQFSLKDWEQAVLANLGGDPRTVQKYLLLAKKIGKIKPYAGNVWEIV